MMGTEKRKSILTIEFRLAEGGYWLETTLPGSDHIWAEDYYTMASYSHKENGPLPAFIAAEVERAIKSSTEHMNDFWGRLIGDK